jgi:hypothetical protein
MPLSTMHHIAINVMILVNVPIVCYTWISILMLVTVVHTTMPPVLLESVKSVHLTVLVVKTQLPESVLDVMLKWNSSTEPVQVNVSHSKLTDMELNQTSSVLLVILYTETTCVLLMKISKVKSLPMTTVFLVIISIMENKDVYSVWKISVKNMKTPVSDVLVDQKN